MTVAAVMAFAIGVAVLIVAYALAWAVILWATGRGRWQKATRRKP